MNHPSIPETSFHVTSESHGFLALCRTVVQEHRSSQLLADALEQAGFTVNCGVEGMKTAFVAEYGGGRPVIAFPADFDAEGGPGPQAPGGG